MNQTTNYGLPLLTSSDGSQKVLDVFEALMWDDIYSAMYKIDEALGDLDDAKADKAVPSSSGNFAALDVSGNLADSGKKASDYANASHAHSGYAETLIFSSVSVAVAAWASDETYTDFPQAATLSLSGVTANHIPEVNFGCPDAVGSNYAPVALSGAGTVKIYAATVPSADITIQSIICIKAVS